MARPDAATAPPGEPLPRARPAAPVGAAGSVAGPDPAAVPPARWWQIQWWRTPWGPDERRAGPAQSGLGQPGAGRPGVRQPGAGRAGPDRGWSARWRRLRMDGLLAAAAVLVDVLFYATTPDELIPVDMVRLSWPAAIGLSLLAAGPIVLRRVAPRAAVVGVLVSFLATVLAVYQPSTLVIAYVLTTYTAAAQLPLRPAIGTAALLWSPTVIAVLAVPWLRDVGVSPAYAIFTNSLLALVCFFVGRTVHARRASMHALEERARVAEENQRALADQAVTDERRRIARELHDVVAHHVSVMGVLATGARRVLPRDPAAVDEVLGTIEQTSRTTLREMRRLLDVLRTDAEPTAADLTPQPGLAGIETLVEQVREAGLPVTLRVDGAPGPLDPGVALTIFRIVQEALTNALKHAGTATAEVRLSFGVYWLIVEVSDTGRGPLPDANRLGHGLVGMRERVALYGGTLRTGPRPGGGYRVYAKMPMELLGAPNGEGAA
jgi:signal transduction histidine kinase